MDCRSFLKTASGFVLFATRHNPSFGLEDGRVQPYLCKNRFDGVSGGLVYGKSNR